MFCTVSSQRFQRNNNLDFSSQNMPINHKLEIIKTMKEENDSMIISLPSLTHKHFCFNFRERFAFFAEIRAESRDQ